MYLLSIPTQYINVTKFSINSTYAIKVSQTSKNHKSITLNINAYNFNSMHQCITYAKLNSENFSYLIFIIYYYL